MALLFFALFNSILGLSVLFPIMGPLGRELGLSEREITSLSTAYAFLQFVSSSYWGGRSETRGRKPTLLIGVIGFSIGMFAFAGVAQLGLSGVLRGLPLYVALLGARMLGGGLSSATLPTAQAWAADLSDRENRTSAMAVIGAAFGLGVIAGPGLATAIIALTGSMLAPLYVSASVALLNAIFVAVRMPEPERRTPRPTTPVSARSLARAIWPLLAVGFATTLAAVGMEQTVSFHFMDRLHLEGERASETVGVALIGYGLVAVFCQGFFVRRVGWSPVMLMRVGLPIALSGFVVMIFAQGYVGLFGAVLLQALGQGLALPGVTAAVSLSASDENQGAAGGLHSTAQALGRTIGPLLAGSLYDLRAILPYVLSAVLLGLVWFAVLVRPSTITRRSPHAG